MTLLKAANMTKSFNQRAVVKGVNIQVASGEIIALLGRNGAGKTTSFQMMVGLLRPNKGAIFLDETDISRYSTSRRAEIGVTYLPQENSVFLNTSSENNLKMILELQRHTRKDKKEIAQRLLEELGLEQLAQQSAHSLSGGERRRLEICRALVLNPKFLLLDEPFSGIDPITIIELQKIILTLKEKGLGIILSDHNVRDTLQITDRAYIIDEGEILVQGSPKEVAADKNARKRFFGDDFRLGQEITLHSF